MGGRPRDGRARGAAGLADRRPGHCLGGGLAMWAALSNPGLEAVAFNPAGLSPAAFATMTPLAMDPVSATSLAGLSVITGRIYAVLAGDGGDRKVRHGLSALGAALGRVAAAGASGDACDFDIGFAAAKRGTE